MDPRSKQFPPTSEDLQEGKLDTPRSRSPEMPGHPPVNPESAPGDPEATEGPGTSGIDPVAPAAAEKGRGPST
jgi:hypothetical protein